MKGVISLVVTLAVAVTSELRLGQDIFKEIVDFTQPIDETLAAVTFVRCAHVKRILGVAYEQIEGEREPDLSKLTLVYKTRSSSRVYNITTAADSILQARGFDSTQKLVIFVHGFTEDPSFSSFQYISESFLESGSVDHILALDGSPFIRWLYLRSTTYVQFMGYRLAETLATLVHYGLDPSRIHIVGHSLGAHISGFTGKRFYAITGRKIGRISGLDPAGPCFTYVNESDRLKETDADYVDVVYTDAGVLGIDTPVGHANYFPNDGKKQEDCVLHVCSHFRAWLYYAESVVARDSFPAVRCRDWRAFQEDRCDDEISYMGYSSVPGTRGLFFLQTRGQAPFGKGLDGSKYVNNNGVIGSLQEEIVRNGLLTKIPGVKSILRDI